jgi:hypothetical protein
MTTPADMPRAVALDHVRREIEDAHERVAKFISEGHRRFADDFRCEAHRIMCAEVDTAERMPVAPRDYPAAEQGS